MHVGVQVSGNDVSGAIDGRVTARGTFESLPSQGGIVLAFGSTDSVPSLPEPRGVDSIRVTDEITGAVLFQDDFDPEPSPEWTVGGPAFVQDGVLGGHGDVTLSMVGRDWKNYRVDATFRNFSAAALMVRAPEVGTGVSYNFRPFREYDSGLLLFDKNQVQQNVPGARAELARNGTVRSLAAMVLEPYYRLFLLLGAAGLLVVPLQFAGQRPTPLRLAKWPIFRSVSALPVRWPGWPLLVAIALAVFGFSVTLFLNYAFGSHLPHVPDEVTYIFQAKLLASGHITAPVPPVKDAFDYFVPPFIVVWHGHWMGLYPFGHPLWLAIGIKLHAMWLMPPLAGAACLLLLFLIGRRVYGARVGLLATLLFATSPFYLMTASNFMSHNTAALYLLASLACVAYAGRRPLLLGMVGGLSFGLLFNTQSLTATAVAAPIGLLVLSGFFRSEERPALKRFVPAFAAGGLIMLGWYFLYNVATTGDAFKSALQLPGGVGQNVGFGGGNTPNVGIQNQQVQLAFLLLVLNGWPLYIGLMFPLLPFALGTRHRWDWFLLISIVCALGIYVLFIGHGIMHGPRYWYVASPLLMLLTARGAERAAEVLGDLARRARGVVTGSDTPARWASVAVVYLFVVALAGSSIYGWLLGRHTTWNDLFVPNSAIELRGFNGADERLVKLVDEAHLHHALVLVQDGCGWQCYGTVFWLNAPSLDGDIVYARDIPERRADLLRVYSDRFVYQALYAPTASLAAYPSLGPITSNMRGPLDAARAQDITPPLPPPTPTPDPNEALRRDDQRRRDLAEVANALQAYHERYGAYPLAEGIQSLCVYVGADAGCRLAEFLDPVPHDPMPDRAYWYRSDGQSFEVQAATEGVSGTAPCFSMAKVPGDHILCVSGATTPSPTPTAVS